MSGGHAARFPLDGRFQAVQEEDQQDTRGACLLSDGESYCSGSSPWLGHGAGGQEANSTRLCLDGGCLDSAVPTEKSWGD